MHGSRCCLSRTLEAKKHVGELGAALLTRGAEAEQRKAADALQKDAQHVGGMLNQAAIAYKIVGAEAKLQAMQRPVEEREIRDNN